MKRGHSWEWDGRFPRVPRRRATSRWLDTKRTSEQAIRIILGTDRGERLMRQDFGAGLNAFVFEPLNQTTCQLVKTRVQEALTQWEPRIDVVKIDVRPGGARE